MENDKKIDLSEIRDHIKWEKDGGFMSTGSLYSQDLLDAIDRVREKTALEPSPNPRQVRTTKEERIEQAAWCRGWKAAMHVVDDALGVKDARG